MTGKEIRIAIKQGDKQRVACLIGDSKDILNMMTTFGTWLHVAAAHGQLEIVKYLVDIGADVNARGGTFNGNALNEAASDGYVEVVEYLLHRGAEMDVSEPERNPLFGAVHCGHIDIVRLLIENGLDPHVKYTGEYMTDMDALAFAHENGHAEIVEFLRTLSKKEEK